MNTFDFRMKSWYVEIVCDSSTTREAQSRTPSNANAEEHASRNAGTENAKKTQSSFSQSSTADILDPEPPLLDRQKHQLLHAPETALLSQGYGTQQLTHSLQSLMQFDSLGLNLQRRSRDPSVLAQLNIHHYVLSREAFWLVALEMIVFG